jgi:hypothetical protein
VRCVGTAVPNKNESAETSRHEPPFKPQRYRGIQPALRARATESEETQAPVILGFFVSGQWSVDSPSRCARGSDDARRPRASAEGISCVIWDVATTPTQLRRAVSPQILDLGARRVVSWVRQGRPDEVR